MVYLKLMRLSCSCSVSVLDSCSVLNSCSASLLALKGAVLDAWVDVYGIKGRFDIDIITEDEELLPPVDSAQRVKKV